jgi:uncharacterized GH25 family protein
MRLAGMKISTLALLVTGARALAHDMWIEPTAFSPDPGEIVGVRLRVGQDLLGDPLPRDPALIQQFVVEDSTGRKPVIGRDGANPAGMLRVSSPGMLVIGYRSNPSTVEETADKFNRYLKEEGLEAIAAVRAKRNESGAPVRELFVRCAKSLVLSGSPRASEGDRPLGFTLELVAERNPYLLGAGEDLPVRLTYENQPLAGALVVALNRRNPAEKIALRTGADGRVRFRLPAAGMWMIKAVHMVPAPSGGNAQWMSYWASLTFEPRTQVAEVRR